MSESIALPEMAFSGRRGIWRESADISEALFDSTMTRRDQASSVGETTLEISGCLFGVCWNLRVAPELHNNTESQKAPVALATS